MVAARGGVHSLGLALSLASPGSLRCPPPVACVRECVRGRGWASGGGGRRSGLQRPAEGGGGCEGRREAMDIERLQEALKGGGSCTLSLPPHPSRLSLLSLQFGWLRRSGPGVGGKVRSPGSHPPPASLGAGALWAGPSRPLCALCPPPASRLGEGNRGGSYNPSPSHPPGAGRGPAAPF